MKTDLVEARLREATHVLSTAGDPRVEVGVEVLAVLVFQQREVAGRPAHRLLGFAPGDRRPQRVHAFGLFEDVGVRFDRAFVGVHPVDVLPVLAERTVETVALVAVAVDEKHQLPAFGTLFTALGYHSIPRTRASGKSRAKLTRALSFRGDSRKTPLPAPRTPEAMRHGAGAPCFKRVFDRSPVLIDRSSNREV